jgi:hypothetical protein
MAFAAIDPGISTLLLVSLAVLLAVLLCALTLVLALAVGATDVDAAAGFCHCSRLIAGLLTSLCGGRWGRS